MTCQADGCFWIVDSPYSTPKFKDILFRFLKVTLPNLEQEEFEVSFSVRS